VQFNSPVTTDLNLARKHIAPPTNCTRHKTR